MTQGLYAFMYFLYACFLTIKETSYRKKEPITVVYKKETKAKDGFGRRNGEEEREMKNSHKLSKEK